MMTTRQEFAALTEEEREERRAKKRAWYARTRGTRTEFQVQRDAEISRRATKKFNDKKTDEERAEANVVSRQWRRENETAVKVSWKKWWLKSNYGLTLEKFEEMIEDQDGCCLICGEAKKLVVDHDHETGKVRGLLCSPCNTGIGHFKDDVDRMLSAIDYLTTNSQPDNPDRSNDYGYIETVCTLLH